MRTYPSNSPQAAARIVALPMLADGRVCGAELEEPIKLGVHQPRPASLVGVHHA